MADLQKQKKGEEPKRVNELDFIGENLGFDGVEAFNLLRTNLMFSFPDNKKCHKIGITSPIPGTGKSLISVNLAYSISKLGKKVLIIDADLRLPTVAQKLGMKPKPGLSNVLVSACEMKDAIQPFSKMMDVMPAGDIPPKPSELLGSARMEEVLEMLDEMYDVVVVDTTPVTVVPDSLVVAKYLDGMILVVRKDHDEKSALQETLRQTKLTDTKLLGVVFNDGTASKSRYGKYYRKGKGYYKKSYSGKSDEVRRYGLLPTLKNTFHK